MGKQGYLRCLAVVSVSAAVFCSSSEVFRASCHGGRFHRTIENVFSQSNETEIERVCECVRVYVCVCVLEFVCAP
eukprot:m.7028 g.7028  ORF g.7028 m.7028 type:complete len:75 (+) comp5380_c0_seq1:25-249(+)